MIRISVRAKPRSKKSRILRADGLSVVVALAALPVDGAANEELVAVLSQALSVTKRAVRITTGAASKNKTVEVDGLTEADARTRLASAAAAGQR